VRSLCLECVCPLCLVCVCPPFVWNVCDTQVAATEAALFERWRAASAQEVMAGWRALRAGGEHTHTPFQTKGDTHIPNTHSKRSVQPAHRVPRGAAAMQQAAACHDRDTSSITTLHHLLQQYLCSGPLIVSM
jgi:hypothetical protein